jgi:nucleoside-diphosphate-sugar epimerase
MPNEIIILGSHSLCGPYLIEHIRQSGLNAEIISRRTISVPAGFTARQIDLNSDTEWQAPEGSIILSLLPLWVLATFLPKLTYCKAIIATSSTSRFSKSVSSESSERALASKLEQSEEAIQNWAQLHGVTWTILRPTIIYDGITDKNITRLADFIRRWGFLPVAYPANGSRQPIHASDVALAMFKCIDNPACANQSFNISGSEILAYKDMVKRIFMAVGRKPCLIKLPLPVLRLVFGLLKPANSTVAMFERMNEDLIFETKTGLAAIGYTPRDFHPTFKDPA